MLETDEVNVQEKKAVGLLNMHYMGSRQSVQEFKGQSQEEDYHDSRDTNTYLVISSPRMSTTGPAMKRKMEYQLMKIVIDII